MATDNRLDGRPLNFEDARRRYFADLELVQNELVAVLRNYRTRCGQRLTAHAVVEASGVWLTEAVANDPAGRPDILAMVDALPGYVRTAPSAPATDSHGPPSTDERQDEPAQTAPIDQAIDAILRRHKAACAADLRATAQQASAPVYARWVGILALHEALLRELDAALEVDGDHGRQQAKQLIEQLIVICAPVTRAH